MMDGDYPKAVECFERLMPMLKSQPDKYAGDIVSCESLLTQCREEL